VTRSAANRVGKQGVVHQKGEARQFARQFAQAGCAGKEEAPKASSGHSSAGRKRSHSTPPSEGCFFPAGLKGSCNPD